MIKVYGDGLDALITINLLLKSGHEVEHYSKTEFRGGHFRGSENCGSSFDLGMVLLEPDFSLDKTNDLTEYEGEFGQNSRAYLAEVYEWLESQVGKLENHSVYVELISGELISDYFISDSFEFIKCMDEKSKSKLKDRLVNAINFSPIGGELHPSLKTKSRIATVTPLVDVLQISFGYDLYRDYFKPFIEKVSGSENPLIAAKDNRRVWMPNFYPESILWAIGEEKMYENFKIEPVQFSRPTKMQIAEFVRMIDAENQSDIKYSQKEYDEKIFSYDMKAQDTISFCNLYDFTKLQKDNYDFMWDFSRHSDNPDYSLSNFLDVTHYCVLDCKPRTVFVLNSQTQAMRYSFYKSEKNSSFSIESTCGEKSGQDIGIEVLNSMGIERACEGYTKRVPIKVMKTPFNLEEWSDFCTQVQLHFKNFNQGLFLIHPEANNFNDNLLRGLAAFRKREKIACD
jgi:hypothetical protein